jgi:hypothetical protein
VGSGAADIGRMPTHPERTPGDLDRDYDVPTARHEPLRGRDGAPLGVEPLSRSTEPEAQESGLARRAQSLRTNRWRSVPPPGA